MLARSFDAVLDRPALIGGRIVDPVERISEILFGLIMALTCTGTISVATPDRFQIRTMLIAALGRNLAWGMGVLRNIDQLSRTLAEQPHADCEARLQIPS